MARSDYMNAFDAEFLKSGFGLSITGTNSDGRSVCVTEPLVTVKGVSYEPTVPARPLIPLTEGYGEQKK